MENYVQLQYQQPRGVKENDVGFVEEAPVGDRGRLKERSDFMPEIVLDVR